MSDEAIDRSAWGAGPWTSEPDRAVWNDDATGLACLALRTPLGHWCGYVQLPLDHAWCRAPYDGADAPDVDVHGGLTFAGVPCGTPATAWWLGFDCAHLGDAVPAMTRVRGGDEYRTLEYVRGECASLARQVRRGREDVAMGMRTADLRALGGTWADLTLEATDDDGPWPHTTTAAARGWLHDNAEEIGIPPEAAAEADERVCALLVAAASARWDALRGGA